MLQFFFYVDDTCRNQDVDLSTVRNLCRGKDILVDVYGSHYWKVHALQDDTLKFRRLEEMLFSYYSNLGLEYINNVCPQWTFVLFKIKN